MDGILDQAGVRAGTRMLEIGSGWGALAVRAAQRGAHVTTITISQEQADLARAAVRGGRPGRGVRIDLQLHGLPRGPGHLRRDRQRRDDRGGRRGVLADVLRHHRRAPRARRHGLHPGDHDGRPPLPGHPELLRLDPEVHLPRRAAPLAGGDRPHPRRSTPRSPSPNADRSGGTTPGRCAMWRDRFDANWPAINAQGFDETFRRMWEFYLAYCEAGFTHRLPRRPAAADAAPGRDGLTLMAGLGVCRSHSQESYEWQYRPAASREGSTIREFFSPDAERGPERRRAREAARQTTCAVCPRLDGECLSRTFGARAVGVWGVA